MALRNSSILAMDFGSCRLCNETKKCRVVNYEYDHLGQKETYTTMLMETFGIQLLNLEGESSERLICAICVVRLRASSAFKQQVLECERNLLATMHMYDQSSEMMVKIEELNNLTSDNDPGEDMKEDMSQVDDEDESQADVQRSGDWTRADPNADETQLDDTETFYDLEVLEESILSSGEDDSKECLLKERKIKKEPLTKKRTATKRTATKRTAGTKRSATDEVKRRISCKKRDLKREKTKGKIASEPSTEVLRERLLKVKALMESRKRMQAIAKPVKPIRIPPSSVGKTKETFMQENTVTIVENSYVCPFNNITGNYYCYYCRTLFTDPAMLREHTLTHNPTPYFLRNWSVRRAPKLDITRIDCRLCDAKIDTIEELKRHLTKEHSKKFHDVSNEFLVFKLTYPEISCMECNEQFFFIDKLIEHMAEHFGKYICDKCGAAFVQSGSLEAHVRCHNKPKVKYPCHVCGKEFTTNRSRHVHTAVVHEKKGVIDCQKCDERFFNYDQRNKHMEVMHGLVRTIPCTLCERTFDNRKTFLNHMASKHANGETVYSCEMCAKTFNVRKYFMKHLRNQHGSGKK